MEKSGNVFAGRTKLSSVLKRLVVPKIYELKFEFDVLQVGSLLGCRRVWGRLRGLGRLGFELGFFLVWLL